MRLILFSRNGMYWFDDGKITEVPSLFLEKYRTSAMEIERRKEWKQQTDLKSLRNMGIAMSQGGASDGPIYRFQGATFIKDEIIYAIKVNEVGGMFRTCPTERRSFEGHVAHYANVEFDGPDYQPHIDSLAYSQKKDAWEEHICIKKMGENDTRQLTTGETADKLPKWDRNGENKIVYQTSSIGRDGSGRYMGNSPWAINLIDLDRKEVESLLGDAEFDYLAPVRYNGEVYCIRRPIQKSGFVFSPALELLAMPFRILKILFFWLDFKSRQYSGRPLTGGDNPARNDLDPAQLEIMGNMIKAKKAAVFPGAGKSKSIVPNSWKLMRRTQSAELVEVRSGVIAFDISPDGKIVYSTGRDVKLLNEGGPDIELVSESFVDRISLA